ncbi:hypothetical protein [Eleftheria terrae]|uniref:hypothetical protein n=1 Tax=Eleftheria terrae TaxID=1597781 RepID=UPI00263B3892|nr:hypothetical protein [Eleftheria terrae]WKB55653.1 hypothetical protein N7L95_26650 [Eleftheria terrae]
MTDNHLGELHWMQFAKRQQLSDSRLVKAMARAMADLELAKEPKQQLLALDAIEKQAAAVRKSVEETKELKGYLKGLDEAVNKQRKLSEFEAKKAAQQEDEDEPASALLDPATLLKQLKLCRQDATRRVSFGFTDAPDKDGLPVLALSPKLTGQKLFTKLKDETKARTGAHGTAWIHNGNELMLQVDKPVSGLVKKVRLPVRECGFKITKVVLVGPDETVLEQDEAVEEASLPENATAADGGVDPGAAFNARFAALLPKVKPAAQEIRAKASEAGLAARKGDFVLAQQLLDETEKLLAASPSGSSERGGSRDAMAQWKAARAAAIASLKSVATEIAAAKHPRSANAIVEIQAVVKNLTAEPSTAQQIDELQNYLRSDEVVHDVSELADDIRTPLLAALGHVSKSLAN